MCNLYPFNISNRFWSQSVRAVKPVLTAALTHSFWASNGIVPLLIADELIMRCLN